MQKSIKTANYIVPDRLHRACAVKNYSYVGVVLVHWLIITLLHELPHRIGGWSFCLFLCPSCFIDTVLRFSEVELRHRRLTRLVPNPDH